MAFLSHVSIPMSLTWDRKCPLWAELMHISATSRETREDFLTRERAPNSRHRKLRKPCWPKQPRDILQLFGVSLGVFFTWYWETENDTWGCVCMITKTHKGTGQIHNLDVPTFLDSQRQIGDAITHWWLSRLHLSLSLFSLNAIYYIEPYHLYALECTRLCLQAKLSQGHHMPHWWFGKIREICSIYSSSYHALNSFHPCPPPTHTHTSSNLQADVPATAQSLNKHKSSLRGSEVTLDVSGIYKSYEKVAIL